MLSTTLNPAMPIQRDTHVLTDSKAWFPGPSKQEMMQKPRHEQNAMKAVGPLNAMSAAQQKSVQNLWLLLTAGLVDLHSLQLTSCSNGASSQQSGPPVLLACSQIHSAGDSSHAAVSKNDRKRC